MPNPTPPPTIATISGRLPHAVSHAAHTPRPPRRPKEYLCTEVLPTGPFAPESTKRTRSMGVIQWLIISLAHCSLCTHSGCTVLAFKGKERFREGFPKRVQGLGPFTAQGGHPVSPWLHPPRLTTRQDQRPKTPHPPGDRRGLSPRKFHPSLTMTACTQEGNFNIRYCRLFQKL